METLYPHIIERVDTGIVVLDFEARVVVWNQWMKEHSGIEESAIKGQRLLEFLPELQSSRIERAINKALHLNCPSVLSAKLLNVSFPLYKDLITGSRDPERLVQSIQIKPFQVPIENDAEGEQYCVISVFDISSADKRERALRTQSVVLTRLVEGMQEKEHELSTLFENAQTGILIFDRQGRVHSANPAAVNLFGMDTGSCSISHRLYDLFDELDPSQFGCNRSDDQIQALMPPSGIEREMRCYRCDGVHFPASVSFNSIPSDNKETRFFVFVRDITDTKRAAEQLNRMARMDGLTGLYNRFSFSEMLAHAIHQHQRDGHALSVFFIDLDRFKSVNDNHGHDAGDVLLQQVGERIRGCCRESDIVARWAGDEFVVVLPHQDHSRSSITVAEKILNVISEPFDVLGKQVFIHCSIGIAQFPDDGCDAERLIFCADQAMYQAKADGKGVFRFFTPAMNERTLARLKTESELRIALQQNQFELYFQPQVAVANDELFGVEALLRWHHPERGIVYPDEFIGIAEDCGLIGQIGEWVMAQAFETASRWYKRGGSPLSMSINISPRQFVDDSLLYLVRRLLNSVGFPAGHIVLEITESHLMEGRDENLALLHALKLLGVKIAIDDFGTGYSSLSYLRTLPVDIIKIDKHFLGDVSREETDARIVSAIIDLAHALELEVVAEGVERMSQMELLRIRGCDHAQGYLFGKPMPIDELLIWYARDYRASLH